MSITQITGQYLVDMTNDLLGGYQNGVDSRALLTYLNQAKDAVWEVTKELHEEYFQVFSQNTTSTATNYFPQLSTGSTELYPPRRSSVNRVRRSADPDQWWAGSHLHLRKVELPCLQRAA